MKTYPFRLTNFHLDILKEIGNIGAGNAATSLSKILNRTINMNVPDVQIMSFDDMMERLGGHEKEIASVFIRIEGDAPGSIFFVLTPEEASMFISDMIGVEDNHLQAPPYNDLAISAYMELGNIVSGSYLSALSDFTNLNMQPSVPSVSIDMVGAILTFGLMELSNISDQVILIDTKLTDELDKYSDITGRFFLLLDPDSFDKIFDSLGIAEDDQNR
ncbi:chemotaxis protein CheC [Salirhabdus sp. Marseille-P4669]|uniref:chemotaxis protein CheC n=1 Tax=Salirhabdus sp. Marseille-P4669 TaxID=2042310 RepID=UPI000C7998E6|nr:chemotaxis protein CheC [Salirhabdus sp. Marseille-P4669]